MACLQPDRLGLFRVFAYSRIRVFAYSRKGALELTADASYPVIFPDRVLLEMALGRKTGDDLC